MVLLDDEIIDIFNADNYFFNNGVFVTAEKDVIIAVGNTFDQAKLFGTKKLCNISIKQLFLNKKCKKWSRELIIGYKSGERRITVVFSTTAIDETGNQCCIYIDIYGGWYENKKNFFKSLFWNNYCTNNCNTLTPIQNHNSAEGYFNSLKESFQMFVVFGQKNK